MINDCDEWKCPLEIKRGEFWEIRRKWWESHKNGGFSSHGTDDQRVHRYTLETKKNGTQQKGI